ncbi:MAG TPA: zinc-ribbon domain-containing protein [Bryobacteraceae bacterium]|nr:zinc-ribbon domain-containing protein [Bryobacteraceae bacterium]
MPFCTQCGKEVSASAAFCGTCGARQGAGAPPPPFPPGPPPDPLGGLSPRTASILCYIPTVGWIAAVVVLASRKFKNDHAVRFHAFQGLYLFAIWLLLKWVSPIMDAGSVTFVRFDHIFEGILLGVSIFMIIKASHQETYVLPIIGELAKRSATE